ncbi:helicase C-terminal domain-containing protein [Kallotenue papyrolyticum]|uniref:helicase C-terminal domain-containing protein n=1 Tax=Kallotenue papyrolyticum TaxID=1325125 RepID=UPI00047852E0|nr:helicase C-terminal domain-containing protein [Kallotenue papyrolyticum]
MNTIVVAIDVETTGLEAGIDEIIEVAAVKFRGDEVLETFQRLVRPRHSLPIKIAQLTGISAAELEQAAPFHTIAPELVRFIKSYPVVGHSVAFDVRMLAAQGLRLAQPAYDTFELATLLLPGLPSYNLTALASRLGIAHPEAHRALADAEVTRRVFVRLLERIAQLDDATLEEIVRLSRQSEWTPRLLFEAVLRERAFQALRRPLPAAELPPPGVVWRGLKPLEPTGSTALLDPAAIAAFFASDGPLSRAFPGYERRDQQLTMTQAVARVFNEGGTLLVEAPTGTGKSMAYLVPAARFAAERGQRVVISTNTINLQDQLFFKDIPALQGVINHCVTHDLGVEAQPFSAALLKGRGNYLCLQRYERLRRQEQLTPEQAQALIKIGLWLRETQSGDRAELVLDEREARVWSDVNATLETCTGARCPAFDRCFFFSARRAAEAAHLVVVNHALLLSDIQAESGVLPRYDHLIIDEAHHLEDVATDQLGWQLEQATLLAFLDNLWQAGGARLVSGLLAELPNYFKGSAATPQDLDRAEGLAAALRPLIDQARQASYPLWRALRRCVEQLAKEQAPEVRLRLTDAVRRSPLWVEVQRAWENVALPLAEIGKGLARLEAQITTLQDAGLLEYDELVLRLGMAANWAVDSVVLGTEVINGSAETIQWLALERQRDVVRLHQAPLHVGPLLQERLFAAKETVVLASATLSIDGSFAYVRERLGLSDAPVDEVQLDSPFDYQRSTLLYLPTDMPEPSERSYQRALEDALIALATATGGRMLALFTSVAALRQTYRAIQEPLEDREIVVLGQGIDGSRRALLQRFREHPRSVLLGTSSFWEGVDIVGEALSVLVIAKLPFAVPSDPVFAARSELFEDAFTGYAVPQAILKFKQGFGRLIRSREDRGVVAVLDRRLLTKRYGRLFLASLPPCTLQQAPLRDLPPVAMAWLERRA